MSVREAFYKRLGEKGVKNYDIRAIDLSHDNRLVFYTGDEKPLVIRDKNLVELGRVATYQTISAARVIAGLPNAEELLRKRLWALSICLGKTGTNYKDFSDSTKQLSVPALVKTLEDLEKRHHDNLPQLMQSLETLEFIRETRKRRYTPKGDGIKIITTNERSKRL